MNKTDLWFFLFFLLFLSIMYIVLVLFFFLFASFVLAILFYLWSFHNGKISNLGQENKNRVNLMIIIINTLINKYFIDILLDVFANSVPIESVFKKKTRQKSVHG
jgi:hypothetical protein